MRGGPRSGVMPTFDVARARGRRAARRGCASDSSRISSAARAARRDRRAVNQRGDRRRPRRAPRRARVGSAALVGPRRAAFVAASAAGVLLVVVVAVLAGFRASPRAERPACPSRRPPRRPRRASIPEVRRRRRPRLARVGADHDRRRGRPDQPVPCPLREGRARCTASLASRRRLRGEAGGRHLRQRRLHRREPRSALRAPPRRATPAPSAARPARAARGVRAPARASPTAADPPAAAAPPSTPDVDPTGGHAPFDRSSPPAPTGPHDETLAVAVGSLRSRRCSRPRAPRRTKRPPARRPSTSSAASRCTARPTTAPPSSSSSARTPIAPNSAVLYNVGEAQYQLQDYAGALTTFERFLAEAAAGDGAPRGGREQRRGPARARRPRRASRPSRRAPTSPSTTRPSGRTPLERALLVSIGRRKVVGVARRDGPRVTRYVDVAADDNLVVTAPAPGRREPTSTPSPQPDLPARPSSTGATSHGAERRCATSAGRRRACWPQARSPSASSR